MLRFLFYLGDLEVEIGLLYSNCMYCGLVGVLEFDIYKELRFMIDFIELLVELIFCRLS